MATRVGSIARQGLLQCTVQSINIFPYDEAISFLSLFRAVTFFFVYIVQIKHEKYTVI
jgi:hypothetical protein